MDGGDRTVTGAGWNYGVVGMTSKGGTTGVGVVKVVAGETSPSVEITLDIARL